MNQLERATVSVLESSLASSPAATIALTRARMTVSFGQEHESCRRSSKCSKISSGVYSRRIAMS